MKMEIASEDFVVVLAGSWRWIASAALARATAAALPQ
jgi:hypothetical protein